MEPLPKQGCEVADGDIVTGKATSQWNPCRSRGARGWWCEQVHAPACLSGTPAEAGVRAGCGRCYIAIYQVSVEPLPKQGCEMSCGTSFVRRKSRLSGTPAEAGVRAARPRTYEEWLPVSVEPLPKQGCEPHDHELMKNGYQSQWNPCRSRGASWLCEEHFFVTSLSQWNPCRSRGARVMYGQMNVPLEKSQWNPCRSRGARLLCSELPR